MSARELAIATLASEPFGSLLRRIDRFPQGRKLLNRLSGSRGVFATFEEGWSVARRSRVAGHEDPREIQIHLEFARTLRPNDYAVLYWLSKIDESELRIFDFGGNVGNLYYAYAPHLSCTRSLEWTVFDIGPILEAGKRIAAQRGADTLKFTDSLGEASRCNVLLASSAFHYWEGSVESFLDQLATPPAHVIVNSSPVHDREPSFITVQRTKTCAFPCVVRNSAEMTASFTARGYTLEDRWPVLERSLRMPLFPDRTVPHYSGFYFRRRGLP